MNKKIITSIRVPARRKTTVLQMSGATLTVGTRVLTKFGEVPVEDLRPGDLVISKDFGAQKLRYIAFQDIDLDDDPFLAPVCLDLSGFGRTFFAPDQRIALRHPMFDMLFGGSEVLITCRDLIDMPGVYSQSKLRSITYVALGFARHHLITCNGILADIGPRENTASRVCLGHDEARMAWRMVTPSQSQPKSQGFPLH